MAWLRWGSMVKLQIDRFGARLTGQIWEYGTRSVHPFTWFPRIQPDEGTTFFAVWGILGTRRVDNFSEPCWRTQLDGLVSLNGGLEQQLVDACGCLVVSQYG
jgi:hypothetical protein